MKLAIINCRSIVNKCTELEALLHVQNLDLLIGTESYLDETVLSSEVFPSQYTAIVKTETDTVVESSS